MSDAQWKVFFDAVRDPIFQGSIPQTAVENIRLILAEAVRQGVSDFRHFAYILATVRGEVGKAFLPVREAFAETDQGARDAVANLLHRGRISRNYALPHAKTGQSYYGRGYAQITHFSNYQWVENELDIPATTKPDVLLQPAIAARAMVYGMVHGKFTSKKLSDYLYGRVFQWQNARRIINGTDRKAEFAAMAKAFNRALWLAFPDGEIAMSDQPSNSIPAGHPQTNAAGPSSTPAAPSGALGNITLAGIIGWVGSKLFGVPAAAPAPDVGPSAFDACYAAIQSGNLSSIEFMMLGAASLIVVSKGSSPILSRLSTIMSAVRSMPR